MVASQGREEGIEESLRLRAKTYSCYGFLFIEIWKHKIKSYNSWNIIL